MWPQSKEALEKCYSTEIQCIKITTQYALSLKIFQKPDCEKKTAARPFDIHICRILSNLQVAPADKKHVLTRCLAQRQQSRSRSS